MNLRQFKIGQVFYMGRRKWLCTDVGTRTIAAICVSDALVVKDGRKKLLTEAQLKSDGWLNGPPYALAELCIDEYDMAGCTARPEAGTTVPRIRSVAKRQYANASMSA